jgi:FAD:protein FMN transferase
VLRQRGADAFLVELGGELRAAGRKPDGSRWRVAVERPDQADHADAGFDLVIALEDAALGSSGDYRSGFIHEGRRYAHTLDPRSGEPVQHGLAAVTVLAPTAMQADALAAALLVLGPDAGWQYAESRGIAAVFTRREADGGYTRRLSTALLARLRQ